MSERDGIKLTYLFPMPPAMDLRMDAVEGEREEAAFFMATTMLAFEERRRSHGEGARLSYSVVTEEAKGFKIH